MRSITTYADFVEITFMGMTYKFQAPVTYNSILAFMVKDFEKVVDSKTGEFVEPAKLYPHILLVKNK